MKYKFIPYKIVPNGNINKNKIDRMIWKILAIGFNCINPRFSKNKRTIDGKQISKITGRHRKSEYPF